MTRIILLLSIFCLFISAAPALADPVVLKVPVTVKVNLKVPGKYWFKYILYDKDGKEPLDPGVAVWSEEMDTSGNKKKITGKRFTHTLGSLGNLDPLDFDQQLWLEIFRYKGGFWNSCSKRLRLNVVPYSLYSQTANGSFAVDLSTNGEYKYSAPRTYHHYIPATAFRPNFFMYTGSAIYNNVGAFLTLQMNTQNPQTQMFTAPVNLPDGADVTRVRCYYYDNSADADWGNLRFSFLFHSLTDVFTYTLGTADYDPPSINNSDLHSWQATEVMGGGDPIDNENNSYILQVTLKLETGDSADNLTRFYGCRLAYELDRVSYP